MEGQNESGNIGAEAPVEDSGDFSLDYSGEPEGSQEPQVGENLPQSEPAPTEDVPKTDEVQIPEPIDQVAALQAKVNELTGIINGYQQKELLTQPQAQAQPQPQQQQTQEQAQQAAQTQPGQVSNLDFLQGRDHIEILGDPAQFNNLLNQVCTVAFTAAVNAAQEKVMRQIPQLVQSSAQQQMAIQNITQQFYEQNKDLTNFRQAVSMAAMQLYNENPNLELPQLLQGAAQRTREMLHLAQAGVQNQRQRVPAQPAGGSVRSGGGNRVGGQPEMTDQQKQILDLLTF